MLSEGLIASSADCCHGENRDGERHVARAHLAAADVRASAMLRRQTSTVDVRRFYAMLVLVGGYFLVELGFGAYTKSLALISDALHMLSDFLALAVGFLAAKYYGKPKTESLTFGFVRLEIVGALVNGVFMLAIVLFIVLEAVERMIMKDAEAAESVAKNWFQILIVGGIGLFVNVLGLFIFGGHSHGHSHGHAHGEARGGEVQNVDHGHDDAHSGQSMNVQGVFIHVLGDALGSVVVLATALIIHFVESEYTYLVDPFCSMFIALILLLGTVPIVKKSLQILLQNVPEDIDTTVLLQEVLQHPGVAEVHEFHLWQLSSTTAVCSLHLVLSSLDLNDQQRILHDVKLLLHRFGIHSSTIQIEAHCHFSQPMDDSADGCHDPICSTECLQKLCCPVEEVQIKV